VASCFEPSISYQLLLCPLTMVVQWPQSTVLPWSEGLIGAFYEVDYSKG
jgi:hypothetical protein